MKHCMSQITVTLSAGNGYSSLPAIDKVELLCSAGFALSGTWNLADGKVTKANDAAATDAAAASTTSITTYAHSVAGATTYRAIVLPGGAFTNSSQFVKSHLRQQHLHLLSGYEFQRKPHYRGQQNLQLRPQPEQGRANAERDYHRRMGHR